ncbi:MAG: TIGR03915 family putative DNA repair protein [Treponema sp.]|jgi:probable DNA metabolism protein|nr:TIGR03915 family putative DNA repair protein [Treponema sp.]
MSCGLCQLFDMMESEVRANSCEEFRLGDEQVLTAPDIALVAGLYSCGTVNLQVLPPSARCLFELSADAFDALVHAWMSELPIETEMIRFGRKVLATGERTEAERAATDRGDPDVRVVLDAAYKVQHEIHRLQGLLRFNPNEQGVYIARCEPDHLVLPALGDYFSERFGDTPWIIIDEKRRLHLACAAGERPILTNTHTVPPAAPESPDASADEWGNLWQQYHSTINNESRNNPALQRKFMPKRYWKYLPEM